MPLETIKSLETLIELARECNLERDQGNVIWWRGHAIDTWKLEPKAYRNSEDRRAERNRYRLFRAGAQTRHLACPANDDTGGWLFLMQHHGLPTRLLDWTESPLVAAFFACREHPNSDGALWVLNPFTLNRNQIGDFVIAAVESPDVLPLITSAFVGNETSENKIVALSANEIDIRMLAQLSAFTLHQPGRPLDEVDGTARFLLKVTIPSACKPQILKDLDGLGIRLPNLFPDLDHLAEYLSSRTFTF